VQVAHIVIPAAQEAEIGRIMVQEWPGKEISKIPVSTRS
jgi:hypothetical protein